MTDEAIQTLVKSDIDSLLAKYVRLMNDAKVSIQYTDTEGRTHIFEANLNKNIKIDNLG